MEAALYAYLFSAFVLPVLGMALLVLLLWNRRLLIFFDSLGLFVDSFVADADDDPLALL